MRLERRFDRMLIYILYFYRCQALKSLKIFHVKKLLCVIFFNHPAFMRLVDMQFLITLRKSENWCLKAHTVEM